MSSSGPRAKRRADRRSAAERYRVSGRVVMKLEARDARAFIELALDQMMSKAHELGARVNERPHMAGANSVFGLVVHCFGVADWWLDHAVLGNPTTRNRDAEFEAVGTVDELDAMDAEFRSRLPALLDAVAEATAPLSAHLEAKTASSRVWSWTTGSIVMHVVEELFQHAGHVDVTADLILERHEVVAAVLVRSDRVLLCHRHPDRPWYPNVWDLPGGHVDAGETRLDALLRELHEELGIDIEIATAASVLRHAPEPGLDIEVWAIEEWAGDVVNASPDEHDELRWFGLDELDSIDLADPGVALACRAAIARRTTE